MTRCSLQAVSRGMQGERRTSTDRTEQAKWARAKDCEWNCRRDPTWSAVLLLSKVSVCIHLCLCAHVHVFLCTWIATESFNRSPPLPICNPVAMIIAAAVALWIHNYLCRESSECKCAHTFCSFVWLAACVCEHRHGCNEEHKERLMVHSGAWRIYETKSQRHTPIRYTGAGNKTHTVLYFNHPLTNAWTHRHLWLACFTTDWLSD